MDEEKLTAIIENSFKNFHAKGLDYICTKRTPEHTRKFYFFDGDVSHLPEVVNPHDHRYDFKTTVLAGTMSNSLYKSDVKRGQVYNEFEWRTPLNGGDGFTFKKETRLLETSRTVYGDIGDNFYNSYAEHFHTIRMLTDNCVLMLDQYEDIVAADKPTITFMRERQAPSLDGLYEKFTADEVIKKLDVIKMLRK